MYRLKQNTKTRLFDEFIVQMRPGHLEAGGSGSNKCNERSGTKAKTPRPGRRSKLEENIRL